MQTRLQQLEESLSETVQNIEENLNLLSKEVDDLRSIHVFIAREMYQNENNSQIISNATEIQNESRKR